MEILEGFGMFWKVLERFLGVYLKTKKGSRKPCGARHGLVGEEDSFPPPNPPAKEGGESD